MAIFKSDFGKHKDVTIVSFGSGDIGVYPGSIEDENKKSVCLSFSNIDPQEIGNNIAPDLVGKSMDEIKEPILCSLEFTNTASIDVLIGLLEEQRELLIELQTTN